MLDTFLRLNACLVHALIVEQLLSDAAAGVRRRNDANPALRNTKEIAVEAVGPSVRTHAKFAAALLAMAEKRSMLVLLNAASNGLKLSNC